MKGSTELDDEDRVSNFGLGRTHQMLNVGP